METQDNNGHSATDQAAAFAHMWSTFATRMAAAGMAAAPGQTPPEATRQMRSAMLSAMSQSAEEFMRSPAYLEMMRESLRASITLRKEINTFLTRAHHETQGAAREDVDAVLLSVRHLEQRLLDRLDTIAGDIGALHQRLDALEGRAKAPADHPGRAAETPAQPTPSARRGRVRRRP